MGKKNISGGGKSKHQDPTAARRFARLWNRRDAGLLEYDRGKMGGDEMGEVGREQMRQGLLHEVWILI